MDTSTEPDMLPFRRISCLRNGKAAAGGSSGTVTVYDCRMLGMLSTGERLEPTGATRLVRRVSRSGGLAPGGLPSAGSDGRVSCFYRWEAERESFSPLRLMSLIQKNHADAKRTCGFLFLPPFNPFRAELIEAAK